MSEASISKQYNGIVLHHNSEINYFKRDNIFTVHLS